MEPLLYIFLGILLIIILYLLYPTRKIYQQNQTIRQQAKEIKYQNQILEEQNRRLTELNREKNQIIGVVSHDLKSPLNRVFALSNLIRMSSDNLTEDQLDYLNRMQIVVADGLGLIRNLLDIRAIEDQGIELKVEQIDLQQFLSEMEKAYSVVVERKEIDLSIEVEDILIQNDNQYLERIFDNLISNAIKYTQKGGKVDLSLSKDDTYITCMIGDEGPGIPKEEEHKLYQKYSVLSTKPTDGESSTGLGLSIVKSLVKTLGGKVWHKNKKAIGTVFYVSLPLRVET